MRFGWLLGVSAVLCSASGRSEPLDPGAARTQLQQGYALKSQGKCVEAIPHFVESVRLDRQPKALLNLADCEETVGKYVSAQSHIVEARDLTSGQGTDSLRKVAEQRLQAIEKKLPRLVVKLARDAPQGTIVRRDGIELGAVSLGIPLPVDPGPHTVVAKSPELERQYTVKLVEGGTQELEVTPIGGQASGPPTDRPAAPVAELPKPPSDGTAVTVDTGTHENIPVVPIVLGGVGIAGAVLATVFGLKAKSTFETAETTCPASGCREPNYSNASQQRADAASSRTVAIIAGVGAGAAIAGGIIVWLAGKPAASTAGIHVVPTVEANRAGIELGFSL